MIGTYYIFGEENDFTVGFAVPLNINNCRIKIIGKMETSRKSIIPLSFFNLKKAAKYFHFFFKEIKEIVSQNLLSSIIY